MAQYRATKIAKYRQNWTRGPASEKIYKIIESFLSDLIQNHSEVTVVKIVTLETFMAISNFSDKKKSFNHLHICIYFFSLFFSLSLFQVFQTHKNCHI